MSNRRRYREKTPEARLAQLRRMAHYFTPGSSIRRSLEKAAAKYETIVERKKKLDRLKG